MTLHTRFTEAYGLTTPIAEAGLGFVGMTDLAIAVSNAGALGSLGVGLMPAPVLSEAIKEIKNGTNGPFNINFITMYADQAQIDAVCEGGAPVASFHWGHPSRAWIDQLHTSGVRVFEQVGSVDDAKRAVDDGIDVVVAQGQESGGHNYSTLPTFALVPLVVDAVGPALVLAAGGVADGRGLAAALMLGADGAWVGTRFVATAESEAHEGYKSRLVAAQATDTAMTKMFGTHTPEFNPVRTLRNRVVREWLDQENEVPADTSALPIIGNMVLGGESVDMHKFSYLIPMRGLTTGDLEEMMLLGGQSVGLITSIEPAGTVVADMTRQAVEMLGRYHGGA